MQKDIVFMELRMKGCMIVGCLEGVAAMSFVWKWRKKMSKYLVYKDMKSKKLVYLYEEEGWEFVGVFTADATCDFIMNMIKMNERAGNIDEHWNELSKQIDKEGI